MSSPRRIRKLEGAESPGTESPHKRRRGQSGLEPSGLELAMEEGGLKAALDFLQSPVGSPVGSPRPFSGKEPEPVEEPVEEKVVPETRFE